MKKLRDYVETFFIVLFAACTVVAFGCLYWMIWTDDVSPLQLRVLVTDVITLILAGIIVRTFN
jgi:hypothetical protein